MILCYMLWLQKNYRLILLNNISKLCTLFNGKSLQVTNCIAKLQLAAKTCIIAVRLTARFVH